MNRRQRALRRDPQPFARGLVVLPGHTRSNAARGALPDTDRQGRPDSPGDRILNKDHRHTPSRAALRI
jgi:hypothetical protein